MTNRIIGIALERDGGIVPRHPHVEGIVRGDSQRCWRTGGCYRGMELFPTSLDRPNHADRPDICPGLGVTSGVIRFESRRLRDRA